MMNQKKREEKPRNRIKIRVVITIIVLLGLLLALLIFIRFGFLEKEPEPHLFVINGECYLILDNLLYQIGNEDDCKKQCSNECWVREEAYFDSEFILIPDSCNKCNCYCK